MHEHAEESAELAERSDQRDGKGRPPKPVTILVNNRPVELDDDHVTGAEIKAAAGVPPEFKLYDPHGHEVDDAKRIKVKEGERFTAISGQDVS